MFVLNVYVVFIWYIVCYVGNRRIITRPFLPSPDLVLSWNLPFTLKQHAAVGMYQIYCYQETGDQPPPPPNPNLWKKVGDVNALPLPMACNLTKLGPGGKYHFAIRALDVLNREGLFSDPRSVSPI
jgi:hypothetical protein